jgi:hypothetical protein
LAHAPERLHEEITGDYNDVIYAATCEEISPRRTLRADMNTKISLLAVMCGVAALTTDHELFAIVFVLEGSVAGIFALL